MHGYFLFVARVVFPAPEAPAIPIPIEDAKRRGLKKHKRNKA